MLANPKTDDGNYHAIWNPTARIYDSVGKSKNLRCKCDVNYHAIRGPAPHFLDSVDRAAGEASLSLEKDATLVPEVSYFTVPFPASSHRLRAPAPYVRQSSTGVQILGGARGALPGIPPGRNYHPDPQLPPWAATTAPNQNYRLEPQLPAPAATNASDNSYRPGSNAILGPKVPPRAATIASGTCVGKFFFRGCARNRFL